MPWSRAWEERAFMNRPLHSLAYCPILYHGLRHTTCSRRLGPTRLPVRRFGRWLVLRKLRRVSASHSGAVALPAITLVRDHNSLASLSKTDGVSLSDATYLLLRTTSCPHEHSAHQHATRAG
jgi:hypothetical protein